MLLWALLCTASDAQTLARPGWAGSGMTVERWWRNAVVFEVSAAPGAAGNGAASDAAALTRLLTRLDDLQTLGADAVLLKGVDSGAVQGSASGREGRISNAFGTLEQFDTLVREASRRRIRVLVELGSTLEGEALSDAARFWLSRGANGIDLGPVSVADRSEKVHALRSVMHSYVGERVVLAEVPGEGAEGASPLAFGMKRMDAPDMLLYPLRGFGSQQVDLAVLRSSLEEANQASGGVAIAELASAAVTGEQAFAQAAVLATAKGGVAIRAREIGKGPEEQSADAQNAFRARELVLETSSSSMSPAGLSNAKRALARERAAFDGAPAPNGDALFRWYQRLLGMHRGNGTMLGGQQSFLNHDDQGALVCLWRGRAGQTLVMVVNLRATPMQLALNEEFSKMKLRGSFLRTVVRTDRGMGAMPLAAVALPGYGVYIGELGR